MVDPHEGIFTGTAAKPSGRWMPNSLGEGSNHLIIVLKEKGPLLAPGWTARAETFLAKLSIISLFLPACVAR